MLAAAMAPAMLAATALTTARRVDECPALMWWAASRAMAAVRLGALAFSGADEGIRECGDNLAGVYVARRLREIVKIEGCDPIVQAPPWLGRTHPEDIDATRARRREQLRGKTECYDHEYRMRGDDGRYRWVRSRGLGVRHENGRVYRMAGSLSDVTQRKLAEPELRGAEDAA